MCELSQQHQQCKGILGKRRTKGGRNKHPHLRQPGKPLACQFAAQRRQEEEDGGFQAGCRLVAMDIPDSHCWWQASGSAVAREAGWGEGWSRAPRGMGFWGWRRPFWERGVPPAADVGWQSHYRALGWISYSLGVQRVIVELCLWHFSVCKIWWGWALEPLALPSSHEADAELALAIKSEWQECKSVCFCVVPCWRFWCVHALFFLLFFSLLNKEPGCKTLFLRCSCWLQQSVFGQIQWFLIRVEALCFPVPVYFLLCCSHTAVLILFCSTVSLIWWMPVWKIINWNYSPVLLN